MEFTDYKCLENLLIEGEDIIATEGFGSSAIAMIKMIGKKFENLVKMLITLLKKLLGIFKSLKVYKKSDMDKISNKANKIHDEAKKYKDMYKQEAINNEKNRRDAYNMKKENEKLTKEHEFSSGKANDLSTAVIDKMLTAGTHCIRTISSISSQFSHIVVELRKKRSDYIEDIDDSFNNINNKFNELDDFINKFKSTFENVKDFSNDFYITNNQRNIIIHNVERQIEILSNDNYGANKYDNFEIDNPNENDTKVINEMKQQWAKLMKNISSVVDVYSQINNFAPSIKVIDTE